MGKKKKIRNKNSRKSMREMPSGIISLYPDLFVVRVGLRAVGLYVSQKKAYRYLVLCRPIKQQYQRINATFSSYS